ncbi:MAG TPA: mechanosensitive ion channel domain-containing protein [Candidatus Acidoferrales bacterium]
MNASRRSWIIRLFGLLVLLVAFGVFGRWFAPQLGDAGAHLYQLLTRPFLTLGGLQITAFFLTKVAIFVVLLILASHMTMSVLQKRILTHTPLVEGQRYAVARVVSYLVFILGMIVGLQSLGVNLNSLVVVGGALGIGVGLGLQAIVSNFVAGLVLLVEQPLKLGDRVEVGGTFGDVVRLRGRSTWIQTNDNVVIIVPNSEFINQRVINWTANDRQVRICMPVGVGYGSDPKEVREILSRIATQHPDVLAEPAPEIILLDFGDSSLDFELRVWTVRQVQTPQRLKSDLYFAIFETFREKGIEIPFPQRDLHLKSISPQVSAVAPDVPGLLS